MTASMFHQKKDPKTSDVEDAAGQRTEHPTRTPWTDPELLNGFPRTAKFLAVDPDKTTVIFKRFDQLSIRNLLHLEGRVAALEVIQRELDTHDFVHYEKDRDMTTVAASWEEFALLGTGKGTRGNINIPDIAFDMWSKDRAERIGSDHNITTTPTSQDPPTTSTQATQELEKTHITSEYPNHPPPSSASLQTDSKTISQEPTINPSPGEFPKKPPATIDNYQQNKPRDGESSREDCSQHDDDLHCDPKILKLIQHRWDIALAIQHAIKDYRNM
jgi:hypothetical protein